MKDKNSSRRRFIKKNLFAASGVMLLGGVGYNGNDQNRLDSGQPFQANRKKIGDMSLEQLRDECKAALFNRFLSNMDSYVIDKQYGGFMCDVDISTRKLRSTNKRAWYEGRGMWTYSFLYNNLEKNPHYLEVAQKSKDFILPHLPKGDSFFVGGYSREGKPLSSVEGDIYGSLFVAEGLAEFSKASGEKQYLELAKMITLSALERYDRMDYRYAISYGPPGAPEIPAPRVNGHWMVFLRSATQMLEQEPDPAIQNIADRCVDAIMQHHLNPDYKLINEGLNHDMSLPDNEWAKFSYLGHGLETLWMVMAEAVRRKNRSLFDGAAAAFERHVAVATDPLYGGCFTGLDNVDKYIFKLDKVLWLQEEVLNGTMILMEHTDDEWAREQFAKTYAYVKDKYVHPEYAFVVESGDRKMDKYSMHRAEHYHHPRRLMLNLLSLKRMIKRGGKVSDLFN
jgi:mannose/cellobiose epimerase-like protein (N-acyl-D-glucosamine 2-epimerase family)